MVVSPIIYKVLYIPGGAGFLPSTVVPTDYRNEVVLNKMLSLMLPLQMFLLVNMSRVWGWSY